MLAVSLAVSPIIKRLMMRLNKDKHIGRVLFIVEGSRTEFSILKQIFCNILGYSYVEKRRNEQECFVSGNDPYSRVAVINTKESNIRDISSNEEYVDDLFDMLRTQYQFPVEQSAIYYLFDRDPRSNKDSTLIESYIQSLSNPYDNTDYKPGQLLLSYPSIESYIISNFRDTTDSLRFLLGKHTKAYIGKNSDIQIHNISDFSLLKATEEFLRFLEDEQIVFDIDDFSQASYSAFIKQEDYYSSGDGFRLFSMLTLAFLQMGIIEV